MIRAKALLAYGHRKQETKKFYRDKFANHFVSGPLNLPQDVYGADIDALRKSLSGRIYRFGWRDGRYVKTEIPPISTLIMRWDDQSEAA